MIEIPNFARLTALAFADAVNPCELAVLTMILLTILIQNPEKRKKVLFAGLAFSAAVFIGYLFYGLIIIQLFKTFHNYIANFSPYLYKGIAILAMILGALNIKDYFMYQPGGIATEMPLFLRPRVKLLIKRITSPIGAFFIGLLGIIRLIRLDFKKEIARITVILLLVFPTSFYFASFYTESLFFALAVWSFYFARKGNWVYSGLLGALATATRLVGIALIPGLIVEAWIQWKKNKNSLNTGTILGLILIPIGIFIYMYYLKVKTGDPLEFFHSVGIFGQQRSASLVLLPQVFYRYIFKILPNVNYYFFPVIFSTFIEFFSGVLFLALSVLSFYKLRFSYAVYLAAGYLIPTLSGSFSSFPRYVLVLFPAFILGALYLERYPKLVKIVAFSILLTLLGIATALFTRGYWVS